MRAFPFASGSGSASASAGDAGAVAEILKHLKEIKAYCGVIPAEQENILADAEFIGGVGDEEAEEEEVFGTPPLTQQDLQGQGQSHGGPAEVVEEEGITMFSMPFTQTPPSASSPSSASSSSSDSRARKRRKPRKTPRIADCTRKVRAGTKIWPPTPTTPTPTPTPTTPAPTPTTAAPAPTPTAPAPAPAPTPTTPAPAPAPAPAPSPGPEQDPLLRIVLMIPPKKPRPTTGQTNLLEYTRRLGIH